MPEEPLFKINGKLVPLSQIVEDYLSHLKQQGNDRKIREMLDTTNAIGTMLKTTQCQIAIIMPKGVAIVNLPAEIIMDSFLKYLAEMINFQTDKDRKAIEMPASTLEKVD